MPSLTSAEIDNWAARLAQAAADRRPIAPLTDAVPDLAIEDAYAIAERIVDRRIAEGARVVGHKIGLTSPAVQQQLGVAEPDFGALLDVMQLPDGGPVAADRFIAPRAELQLAFELGEPLAGPGVTVSDVRRATAAVRPAFELVDSRIADWRIRLADTVADGKPWVVPMLYGRAGDRILLHGSVGAGALRHVAAGAPARVVRSYIPGIGWSGAAELSAVAVERVEGVAQAADPPG